MRKRALILTHGYGKAEQNEFRDRLANALNYYTDGFGKIFEPDPRDESGYGVRRLVATERHAGAPSVQIDIYEAYWADMIPADAPANPIRRVTRGFRLIAYWFFGGTSKLLRQANYLGVGLAMSGVLILLWYLALLLLAAKALIADPSHLPGWATAAIDAARAIDSAKAAGGDAGAVGILATLVSWVESMPWYGVFAAMLAGLPVDRMAAVAEFSKAYLTDEKADVAPAGLRARTKQRLVELLEAVYASPNSYDEVFVVGHSIGAAIALDALADYGDERARTTFFTWGSPLKVFSAQEPQIDAELKKLMTAEPPLAGWLDIVLPNDWVAAKAPGHEARYGVESSIKASSPQGWMAGWNASSHEDYYRSPEALLPLVAGAPPPAAKASGEPPRDAAAETG